MTCGTAYLCSVSPRRAGQQQAPTTVRVGGWGGGGVKARLVPGGGCPLGPDYGERRGMGNDMWVGQIEGSVVPMFCRVIHEVDTTVTFSKLLLDA